MLRVFRHDILYTNKFVVTLELVPGRESRGIKIDSVLKLAAEAYSDGRVSAVSITDNPGGNPSLSPDGIGNEIFSFGMDVITHFTCRDSNRIGMESRAWQLDRMGMKNILALTGDYSGTGFGGQGMPVFDLDSVTLIRALSMLSGKLEERGDPEGFLIGCAVSPFKSTEGESFTQYLKMCRKISAGAHFIITQLGYDARKFQELLKVQRDFGIKVPTMASIFHLTPAVAQSMNKGKIPGVVVPDTLLKQVRDEWRNKLEGRKAAIERSAKLIAVVKGLGYRGIHISGIHQSFETAARILDRAAEIGHRWEEFLPEFNFQQENVFYMYRKDPKTGLSTDEPNRFQSTSSRVERIGYRCFKRTHDLLFAFDSPLARGLQFMAGVLDKREAGHLVMSVVEDSVKILLLGCRRCGDCAIQHVAFLCPESQCPKHVRNGPCGGSRDGRCEVRPERFCVWFRAYQRLAAAGQTRELAFGCIPPRMWELNGTSSWLNFHMRRDHQTKGIKIAGNGRGITRCSIPTAFQAGRNPEYRILTGSDPRKS
ncbi:MAG: methylenetetrahydrofolate reductase C-terminal domain-containing protein [Syntrophobacter sp.]